MGTHRLICIRADGNHEIASGHLVRCLAVASACQSLGMQVCFLVSEGESYSLLKGFLDSEDSLRIIRLKTAAYDDLEKELPEVSGFLRSLSQKPVYLLDSYYVTERYLTTINSLSKTAFLDDLQLFDYPVDLLVNYDVMSGETLPAYQTAYQNSGQLLLGAAYAPLRPQFQNNPITVREQVKNILVTTGGSDPSHFCLRFLQSVKENSSMWPFLATDIRLHLVIGKLNTDKTALYGLSDGLPLLKLHENVTDMASLMRNCDLAISAAGTTLYELCALGIPAISFTMADNQIAPARAFDAAGAIPCAGDIRREPGAVMHSINTFVTSMSHQSLQHCFRQNSGQSSTQHSYSVRKSAHEAMRKLVDGNGALRIAKALEKI